MVKQIAMPSRAAYPCNAPKNEENSVKEKVLQAVIDYIQEHGYAPTIREIKEAVGLKSTSSVEYYLLRLLTEGKVETDHVSAPRAIRVPGYKFIKVEESNELQCETADGDRCQEQEKATCN